MATGCGTCDGTGKVVTYQMIEQFCGHCGGTGNADMPDDRERTRGRRARTVDHRSAAPCPHCLGRGRALTKTLISVNCSACQGKGQIWSHRHIPYGQSERRSPDVVAGNSGVLDRIPS
jgi:RecJ-like exonuclease